MLILAAFWMAYVTGGTKDFCRNILIPAASSEFRFARPRFFSIRNDALRGVIPTFAIELVPIHEPWRRRWALLSVSNSVRRRRIRKVTKIKGLRGGVPRYVALAISQVNPPEAEERAICGC